jgi:hypothetical protein
MWWWLFLAVALRVAGLGSHGDIGGEATSNEDESSGEAVYGRTQGALCQLPTSVDQRTKKERRARCTKHFSDASSQT